MKRIIWAIDLLNQTVGRLSIWLVLISALISAGNAVSRYVFKVSSNSMLEIQWYLFSMIFLLCAGYTFQKDGHVRIDVIYGRFPAKVKSIVNILGGLFFLLPVCGIITKMSWDMFLVSYGINEGSPDAGGLLRWPIKLIIPVGFALLFLQGISQISKEILKLCGDKEYDTPSEQHKVE